MLRDAIASLEERNSLRSADVVRRVAAHRIELIKEREDLKARMFALWKLAAKTREGDAAMADAMEAALAGEEVDPVSFRATTSSDGGEGTVEALRVAGVELDYALITLNGILVDLDTSTGNAWLGRHVSDVLEKVGELEDDLLASEFWLRSAIAAGVAVPVPDPRCICVNKLPCADHVAVTRPVTY